MKALRKRIVNFLPYAVLEIVGIFLLFRPIADGDEIWNYNFARNICAGRVPYADFNMIQTPLAAYLAGFFLKIFGDTLLNFRILAICLLAGIFGSLYWICEKITKSRSIAFVISSFVYGLNFLLWNYNYNNLNLLIIIFVLCLDWKKLENRDEKSELLWDILIGLLVGIMPLVKQSTGAVFLLLNSIMCIFSMIFENKKWKQKVGRMVVSFIPAILFVGVLVWQQNLGEFYDYAIAGIAEFTHRITYFEYIFSTPFAFLMGVFPLVVIGVYINVMRTNRKKIKDMVIFLLWAIGGLTVAYPLCDSVHMVVAIVPFVPCILLCCKEQKLKVVEKYICCFVAFIVLCVSVITTLPSKDGYKKCELEHFKGMLIEEAMEENIIEVMSYITGMEEKGQKVVVADEYGALYSIPLKQCHKDFDMLLVGNLGTSSVDSLLDKCEKDIVLVRRDENTLGYQANREFISEVKHNYEKIDEVSSFDAYISKEKD